MSRCRCRTRDARSGTITFVCDLAWVWDLAFVLGLATP
jgi:hypothetical protein